VIPRIVALDIVDKVLGSRLSGRGAAFKIKTKAGVSWLHDHLVAVALAIERAAAVAKHERLRQ
jgi:hypothetical protein